MSLVRRTILASAAFTAALSFHQTALAQAVPERGAWLADKSGCKIWDPKPIPNEEAVWRGTCENGFAKGHGTLDWRKDGVLSQSETGEMDRGRFVGQKTINFANGAQYIGDELNGEYHYNSGDVYTGSFVNGKRSGFGTYVYKNGNAYTGQWVDGKRTGRGKMTFSNGAVYSGEFIDGSFSGNGEIHYIDGTAYVGTFSAGKPNGNGAYSFKDGSKYTGSVLDGKKTGIGRETSPDGTSYEGQWLDNKYQGEGVLIDPNAKYVGSFADGQFNGHGSFTFDGATFVGDFRNGLMNGAGILTTPEAGSRAVLFVDGQEVRPVTPFPPARSRAASDAQALAAAAALLSPKMISPAPVSQAFPGVFTKCSTINGSIIVVQAPTCPAGTMWEGPG